MQPTAYIDELIRKSDLSAIERANEDQENISSSFSQLGISLHACIDRMQEGYTEKEQEEYPTFRNAPPPTEDQAKRLPRPDYNFFYKMAKGKGRQRGFCKVDAQRRLAYELSTAVDRSHYHMLERFSAGKSGSSLYAK